MPNQNSMQALIELMARLRDPQTGCPWDQAQTMASIVPHTIEEAYEVAEAIEAGNWQEIRSELGDLLFQVVFYARIAQELGKFDFADIASGVTEKMIRRHPHVFGDAKINSTEEQSQLWENIKAEERTSDAGPPASVLDGIGEGLPSTVRARKLQNRAARVGFDWPDHHGVVDKIAEELQELEDAIAAGNQDEVESEMGDILFVCINLSRHLKVDPDAALRRTSRKFVQRFQLMEQMAQAQSTELADLPLEQQEALWQAAKRRLADES